MTSKYTSCTSDRSIAASQYNECTRPAFPGRITIYDTTLRDGEQMCGVAFTPEQKLDIARMLDEIRIPQIEAGFPSVSESELRAVKMIMKEKLDAEVLVLSRCCKPDLENAVASDADMVLIFIAASDIHLKHKLKITKDEAKKRVAFAVNYAVEHGLKVGFSTEDSTRADIEFQKELFKIACETGASRTGITDTLGCASPEGFGYLVGEIRKGLPKNTELSVHCHNDCGLALANTLAGLKNGANAAAATINGMGERAGNLSTEQVVMALKVLYGVELGIDTSRFTEISRKVAKFARLHMAKNHPWTGRNVFSHESGIHVKAVLEEPFTYELVSPELVGNKRHLPLGKHSGQGIIREKIRERGINVDSIDDCIIEEILKKVKERSEKKGKVSDKEFWRIVETVMNRIP